MVAQEISPPGRQARQVGSEEPLAAAGHQQFLYLLVQLGRERPFGESVDPTRDAAAAGARAEQLAVRAAEANGDLEPLLAAL